METVTLEGKEYVKAKSAARELGYTSDYIGQLCRAGKIDSRLVGRSWYVDIGELSSHKQSRYGTKGTKSIKVHVSKSEEKGNRISIHQIAELPTSAASSQKFTKHVYWNAPKYEPDDQALMPEVQKAQTEKVTKGGIRLTVTPTDAESIEVKSEPGESYKMSATELPTVRLNGVLKVNPLDEQYEESLAADAEQEETTTKKVLPLKNTRGAISMKRLPVAQGAVVVPVTVRATEDSQQLPQKSQRPLSRFEQRVQEKSQAEAVPSQKEVQKVQAEQPAPVEVATSKVVAPAATPRQGTPVALTPYVTAAVALASVTLVLLFGLNVVVTSNQIATKQTLDFNPANLYQVLFQSE